jgi:hypothetical protein
MNINRVDFENLGLLLFYLFIVYFNIECKENWRDFILKNHNLRKVELGVYYIEETKLEESCIEQKYFRKKEFG